MDGEEIADLNAQGNAVRRYIPGAAIDQRVAQVEANNAVSYIHTDRQNSVIAISDSAGAITKRRAYGPYGETDATQMTGTGGASHPFGYTGRRYEPDLNLYYYRARWYDPSLGTFLETDPIGSLDYVNLYSYVGLEPGNATDPSGMREQVVVTAARVKVTIDWVYYGQTVSYYYIPIIYIAKNNDNGSGDGAQPQHGADTYGTPSGPEDPDDQDREDSYSSIPCDGHHCIPREILRKLDPEVRRQVQGRRGAPNIVQIPRTQHVTIHRAGYNQQWTAEIAWLGKTPKTATVADIQRIDALIRSRYGL